MLSFDCQITDTISYHCNIVVTLSANVLM